MQAQYTGGARKSASGILESAPVQGFAAGQRIETVHNCTLRKKENINSVNIAGSIQKEFRAKSMPEWSVTDVCDWLDSLFLSEYKVRLI